MKEIKVPTLGESVTEATVATWFKKVGEKVSMDEMVCELETDKVTVEVPSTTSGVLKKIVSTEGTTVNLNAVLAIIDENDEVASETAKEKAVDQSKEDSPLDMNPEANKSLYENAPSAKKLMKENNLLESQVSGSGRDGRIMREDVVKKIEDTASEPDFILPTVETISNEASKTERVKMSRLRQTIAKRLKEAQNSAAMLTTYNEVDMSQIITIRNKFKMDFEHKHGTKLGFMSFFIKSCCHALNEIPEVNAEIDGTDIVYKNFVHMSIAVGTSSGLVAPVIKNADTLSFSEIEKTISSLSDKARSGKLSISEMQGGTFTISNGGVYGSLMSSPILNPPQSGILGMHKIQDRPMAIGGEVVVKPMMYIALSYDHRIVDGKGAVTFLVRVKEALEDPNRLLMDL